MTAIKEYQKLESGGLWRARPEDQKREVVLSFGDTSLVIRDRSNAPLTHWSLSAIERINPGKRPALFEPGLNSGENLEIDDDLMINAIEKVRMTIARRRPKQGRLRVTIFMLSLVGIVSTAAFWLPDALLQHTTKVLPDTKREDIGRHLLNEINKIAGETCNSRVGTRALAQFHQKLDPTQELENVLILPSSMRQSTLLPGNILLLSHTLVEDHDTPEVLAGYILSGIVQAQEIDPLVDFLSGTGTAATFGLLTTGEIELSSLRNFAQTLMKDSESFPSSESLMREFSRAQLSTKPYAFARDFSGETTLDLIEADPVRSTPQTPLIPDGDWVSIQSICEN